MGLIEQNQSKSDVQSILDQDELVTDIACASYDIAFYMMTTYQKNQDIRNLRRYIEGKINQYVDSCIHDTANK